MTYHVSRPVLRGPKKKLSHSKKNDKNAEKKSHEFQNIPTNFLIMREIFYIVLQFVKMDAENFMFFLLHTEVKGTKSEIFLYNPAVRLNL